MLDPAFRMVTTLFPIYAAIAIDTTYANNPLPITRQMGVGGGPRSRTYCMGASLFGGHETTTAPSVSPRHLVLVYMRRRHKKLRVLRMRSYWRRLEEGAFFISPPSADSLDLERADHALVSHRTN